MRFQLKREWVIPAAVGVVSFVAGSVAGYLQAERKYKGHIKVQKGLIEIQQEQLDYKKPSPEDFESKTVQLEFAYDDRLEKFNAAMQQATHVIRELREQGAVYLTNFAALEADERAEAKHSHPTNGDGSNVVNIFPAVFGDNEDWNYALETEQRTPDKPYIIHRDEYYDNEDDSRQSTLTYYEGDNILCDGHDTPVYDAENVVGILKFGHGSLDPNVCYVRNERLMAEYEVLRDGGYYQVEVLGEALEEKDIKHSKQLTKFRMD